ncbi:MAG: FAD:protein FMN transferase [Bacilli bacterium]|nr:FAD:protein FMN transferase [Bacilli bacterium]
MFKKIIDRRNYIILFIIIVLFVLIVILNNTRIHADIREYNYFDEKISLELYTNKNAKKIFEKVDSIYRKYNNFYKKPLENDDEDFIKLLEYGKELYVKTDGYIDITSHALLKSIKEDKEYSFETSVNDLDFKNRDTLVNINIESIIGSYASIEVEKYLKSKKLKYYIIKEDSNIIVGAHYDKKKYNIPIVKDDNIIDVLALSNKSVAIKGDNDVFKPYMINPITSRKNTENKMIVVIADDINTANFIASTLYLMSVEDGKEFIKRYSALALWYTNNGVEKTNGFEKYEILK